MEKKTNKEPPHKEKMDQVAKNLEDFHKSVQIVMSYESACEEFILYLEKNGTKGESDGLSIDIWDFIYEILCHTQFKHSNEEIYSRVKALTDQRHSNLPKFTDKTFQNNVYLMKNFPEACHHCLEIIKANGGLVFGNVGRIGENDEYDALAFMDILLNHFETGIHKLKAVKNEHEIEIKEGNFI